MNDTIDLMHHHRSIRVFEAAAIPDADIHEAVRSGQMASSSSNIQAYCLIRITDPRNREQLIELTGGQPMVAACGAFFVVCGDTRRHRLICEANGLTYDTRFDAFILAIVDASLFAQNLVLAFESQGYGICYIGGLRNHLPEISVLLGIPHGVYPLYGLCVGIPAEQPLPRPRLPREAVYFEDRYPTDEFLLGQLSIYRDQIDQYEQSRGENRDPWIRRMAEKFSRPRREDVAEYYRSQGADLS